MNPGIITIRRKIALHGINEESAGNDHLKSEESTGGWGFHQELPAHRRGIPPKKGIPAGITCLFTRIQAGKIKTRGKSFER
jgi:hypothetical protein